MKAALRGGATLPDTANFVFPHRLGRIHGWFSNQGLSALTLPTPQTEAQHIHILHSSANDMRVWALNAALERYFAGILQRFDEIPLDLSAGTPFQLAVWQAAREVGWGQTCTYGELARRIGKPGASRAVGQALGLNPVPIIVPCHRILAHNGRIGGFSCGLEWKRELLAIEGLAPA